MFFPICSFFEKTLHLASNFSIKHLFYYKFTIGVTKKARKVFTLKAISIISPIKVSPLFLCSCDFHFSIPISLRFPHTATPTFVHNAAVYL